MKIMLTILASAALLILPSSALAGDRPDHAPGQQQAQQAKEKKTSKAEKTSKAKAYGKYCQGQSKKHMKGEKGTAFSRCVTAMAKADRVERLTARKACRALSKKRVKGEKGTPFSRCVVGVAQMRKHS